MLKLIFISLLATFAHAEIKFPSGDSYPDSMDLKNQFNEVSEKQSFGACHIYAAVGAIETACSRHTGKKIKLSEAYEFYRHSRIQLDNPNSYKFIIDTKDGQFSSNDAGAYEVTLSRIINEGTMNSSQFSMGDIKDALVQANRIRNTYSSLSPEQRKKLINEFEEQVRKALKQSYDKKFLELATNDYDKTEHGYKLKLQNDNPASQCDFQEMRYKGIRSTPESMVAFLAKGFPVICQYYFDEKKPERGQHVVIYGGYAKRPDLKDGIGFMIRNSNYKITLDTGYNYSCKYSTIVYHKSEEAVVKVIESNLKY